jgi:hypothetical protein
MKEWKGVRVKEWKGVRVKEWKGVRVKEWKGGDSLWLGRVLAWDFE